MEMKNDEFDRFFDKSFEKSIKSAYKSVHPPDSKESFKKVQIILERKKKRRYRIRRIQLIAGCFFLMFFGAVVFGNIDVSKAFSPLNKAIQFVKEEVVNYFIGTWEEDNSGAKTEAPPDFVPVNKNILKSESADGFTTRKQVSLEEAKGIVLFDFYIPKDLPQGFTLKRIEVYYESNKEKAHMIDMWYEGTEKGHFSIIQRQTEMDSTVLSSTIEKTTGSSKELQIRGYPAILIQYNDGIINFKSIFNDVLIDLSGTIDEGEVLEVVNSLKEK